MKLTSPSLAIGLATSLPCAVPLHAQQAGNDTTTADKTDAKVNPNQFLPENGLKLFNSGRNIGTLVMGKLDRDTRLASAGSDSCIAGTFQ
ncbi:MAG: hypothetical protein EPN69_05280 [Rhodanobacter sp.]|nr:MAG: hypothetical protein EPN69_05280 [Rhodanobacter sp.]TAM01093.1 MAG: hypothetical protein EPN71_05915 [Rhodanobacter sp.]TAM40764.1 MAG: hypothetical protein EPN58_09500 [Rhodanobacter sp.]